MAWGLPTPVAKSVSISEESKKSTGASSSTAAPVVVSTLSAEDQSLLERDEIDVYENVTKVKEIQLDGVVLLQIIKHCHENLPTCVAGSLLGMEQQEDGNVLEITNSFPSPSNDSDKNKRRSKKNADTDGDEYQINMMKNLRDVNMDNNKVGWYQSALMGSFCSASVIEYQFQYQEMLGPNAVCLIYDPSQTTKGSLSIKAFRLSSSFYEQFKAGVFTKESFAKMDIRSNNILEEIPIKIHNSDLAKCYLYEITKENSSILDCDFDRLNLSTNSYLESSLEHLTVWADELAAEHHKFQGYERALSKQRSVHQLWLQKRREENKARRESGQEPLSEDDPTVYKSLNAPNRLESLLITKQMNTYCEQINRYAGKSFQNLFLAGSLHKE